MANRCDRREETSFNEDNACSSRRNDRFAQALEEAFNEGYKKGYCAGYEDGYEKGYCEGYTEGVKDGLAKAKEDAICALKRNRCCKLRCCRRRCC